MTTVAVVQARAGSTRLPQKVLADLAGRPVLVHVLERCATIEGVDHVVCAIPASPQNDPVAWVADRCHAKVFRGDENDVLLRTFGAARMVAADTIVRITSDCPLVDPEVCGRVLDAYRASGTDYASNIDPRSFPQGLDCEVFSIESLRRAVKLATSDYDREHVTPHIWREIGMWRVNVANDRDLQGMRWTLDWPEDLEFMRAIHAHGRPHNMGAVLDILAARPEIEKINAKRAA